MKYIRRSGIYFALALSFGVVTAAHVAVAQERRVSGAQEDLATLGAAIEQATGAVFSRKELKLLTEIDPLPPVNTQGTEPANHQSGDPFTRCMGGCDAAHASCLNRLWFFVQFRCNNLRQNCQMACAIDALD